MGGNWIARPGHLVVVGSFGDVDSHHHPAVQLTVGIGGWLEVTDAGRAVHRGGAVVVASGARHEMSSAGASAALSVYFSPETTVAATLNARVHERGRSGVLVAGDGSRDAVQRAVFDEDLGLAADLVLEDVLGGSDGVGSDSPVPAHLRAAVDVVGAAMPGRAALSDVAREVALSPDYLGRLFRTHTGASFLATVRWQRLLAALSFVRDGANLTDAAHQAGFTDSAHASRTCRELTGATPSTIVRALG